MRLAVCSDLHFHPFPAFAKIGEDGLNSRLKLTYERARDIIRIAKEQKCYAILFAGDLFHTKRIDAETIDVAVRAFADCDIPIIGVPGNHDMATFGGSARHSARALGGKIRWLDDFEGRSINLPGAGEDVLVYGIPYVHTTPELLVELAKVPKGVGVLLMHAGFAGGFMGSDYIADLGDCTDYMAVKGKAKLVVSGHFHQPQLIMFNDRGDVDTQRPSIHGPQHGTYEDGRAILVPGSPEQHTWGDKDGARGFWIVDTSAREAHFRQLGSPQFVEVTAGAIPTSLVQNQYVRIVGNPSECELGEMKNATPHFVVEHAPTQAARPQRAFEVAVGDAPGALVQKYVEHSDTALDRTRLIQEGKRLLGCN